MVLYYIYSDSQKYVPKKIIYEKNHLKANRFSHNGFYDLSDRNPYSCIGTYSCDLL